MEPRLGGNDKFTASPGERLLVYGSTSVTLYDRKPQTASSVQSPDQVLILGHSRSSNYQHSGLIMIQNDDPMFGSDLYLALRAVRTTCIKQVLASYF